MGFSDLKKSLQEAIKNSDNFSEFDKLMPDFFSEKGFNLYKKEQQGKNGEVKKFKRFNRSLEEKVRQMQERKRQQGKKGEGKKFKGLFRESEEMERQLRKRKSPQQKGIPRTPGIQESIDVARGKPAWIKRGGLPKKPKMTGTGSYKGKKHSYAAGGMVKELKI